MKNIKGEDLTIWNLPAHWLEDYHVRIQAGMISDLNVAADQLSQVTGASEMRGMQKTSDAIFKTISSSGFKNFREAEQAILHLYVPDMDFDRGGICHALKRLERHYKELAK